MKWRANLGLDDVDHFTLIGDELDQLRNKSGATRLGFAVLLKFLLWRGRFPRELHEVPDDAVAHLARQVRVPATELEAFDFASRTAKRHPTEIRVYTGFRECSVADAEALTGWLTEHVASSERRPERVRDELIGRCRAELDRITRRSASTLCVTSSVGGRSPPAISRAISVGWRRSRSGRPGTTTTMPSRPPRATASAATNPTPAPG